jgi:histone H3/H4
MAVSDAKPARKPSYSRQGKAGLVLSVARVNRALKAARNGKRVSDKAPLFITGTLECLADTVFERAVENAKAKGLKRVTNVDIVEAVRTDPDLARLYSGFAFASHAPSAKPIKFILSSQEEKKRKQQKEDRHNNKPANKSAPVAAMP